MPVERTPTATPAKTPNTRSGVAKARTKDDRRGQLLQIAARMFASHGFEATTTRMIAKEAHILSGSLYHHFGTKDEMLHEILQRGVREMSMSTDRITASAAEPEVKLVALILLHINELFDDHYAFSILYNDRRFLRRHPDFIYVADAKKAMFLNWCGVLDQGRDAGMFRAAVDPYMVVTTIIRMLNTSADWFLSSNEHEYDGPIPSDRVGLTDFNIDIVLRIVRAPGRMDSPTPYVDAHDLVVQSQNDSVV